MSKIIQEKHVDKFDIKVNMLLQSIQRKMRVFTQAGFQFSAWMSASDWLIFTEGCFEERHLANINLKTLGLDISYIANNYHREDRIFNISLSAAVWYLMIGFYGIRSKVICRIQISYLHNKRIVMRRSTIPVIYPRSTFWPLNGNRRGNFAKIMKKNDEYEISNPEFVVPLKPTLQRAKI